MILQLLLYIVVFRGNDAAEGAEGHLVAVGAQTYAEHSSGDKPIECVYDYETEGIAINQKGNDIGAQCCTSDGSSAVRKDLPGGTGSDGCLTGVSYNTAKAACQELGYRLCTVEEVEGDVGKGTGCSHDQRHVWTMSDPCDPSQEFEIDYTATTLTADGWTNEGTLFGKDLSSLKGTVKNSNGIHALCFDETQTSTDYINFIDYNTNSGQNPELTMIVWVNPEPNYPQNVLMGSNNGGLDRSILLNLESYKGIALGTGASYESTVSNPTPGEWTSITATFSKSAMKAIVYKNGGTISGGEQHEVTIASDSVGHEYIGLNGPPPPYAGYSFVGCIGRVQIINRVLNANEVADVFSEGIVGEEYMNAEETSYCPGFAEETSGNGPINHLCEKTWNILSGEWQFDECKCTLTNTQSTKSIVWFGSADGVNPDDNFMKDDFQLKVRVAVTSELGVIGVSGIILRQSEALFHRIGISSTGVTFYNGNTVLTSKDIDLTLDVVYELKILRFQTVYDVYIDNKLLLDDVEAPQLTTASIGIFTQDAFAIFHSIAYQEAVDAGGNIGSLQINSEDGTVAVQSGSTSLSKLFCGAAEDEALWAGILSLNQELLDLLFDFQEHDVVSSVLEYIQCSEIIYGVIDSSSAMYLRPPAIALNIVNRILKLLQNIPHIGEYIELAADEISELIVDVLNAITPDFVGIHWQDYHEYDGSIFNPFESMVEALGNMLSQKVCSTIFGNTLPSMLEELGASEIVSDIKSGFDQNITSFLEGDSPLFTNELKTKLLTNNLYKEFSFVLTIGMEICLSKVAKGCIMRMHSISMNLKGESQIFESRSIYIESPTKDIGISSTASFHVDFLSNYLDVINKELALNVGLSAEIPSIDVITKFIDQWESHSGKASNIPFIGGGLGEGVGFVNGLAEENPLIMEILKGGFSAKLGIIFGLNPDRYQDLMNCNGFRLSLSVGDIDAAKFRFSYGYEYRKERNIPQSWHWVDEMDMPNYPQMIKFIWHIGKDGINVFDDVLSNLGGIVTGWIAEVDDYAEKEVENIMLGVMNKVTNEVVDKGNDVLGVITAAKDTATGWLNTVDNKLYTAEHNCKNAGANQCHEFAGVVTVCLDDFIPDFVGDICNPVFDLINAPIDGLQSALNLVQIPHLPEITITSIDQVFDIIDELMDIFPAKQDNILNVDQYQKDQHEFEAPTLHIVIPTFVYVMFIAYTIAVGSLMWICGYYMHKMRHKDHMGAPVNIKYRDDESSDSSADTDINL